MRRKLSAAKMSVISRPRLPWPSFVPVMLEAGAAASKKPTSPITRVMASSFPLPAPSFSNARKSAGWDGICQANGFFKTLLREDNSLIHIAKDWCPRFHWLSYSPRLHWATDRINLSVTNLTAFEWDLLVSQDKGYFTKEDLDVRITYMASNLVINALIAGQTQIAKSGTHFGILAAVRKAHIKIFAGGLYGYPYDTISQPDIKSLADLKGQKIVTGSQGTIVTVIFTMPNSWIGPLISFQRI